MRDGYAFAEQRGVHAIGVLLRSHDEKAWPPHFDALMDFELGPVAARPLEKEAGERRVGAAGRGILPCSGERREHARANPLSVARIDMQREALAKLGTRGKRFAKRSDVGTTARQSRSGQFSDDVRVPHRGEDWPMGPGHDIGERETEAIGDRLDSLTAIAKSHGGDVWNERPPIVATPSPERAAAQ
jgi:hypothetical protein